MTSFEDDNVKEAKEGSSEHSAQNSIAGEVAKQLTDYVQHDRPNSGSDNVVSKMMIERSFFSLSDKDRKEALTQAGNSLDAMVKGDIPHLKERLKELGLSTKELEEKEKALTEKVEAAKPLEEAILKGDAKAMQKILSTMDPKQLDEVTNLIQKHFDKTGMGLEVDYADGKLIISPTNGEKGVAISADKLQLIGVNKDGSYDFNRQFRHANPANELKGYGDNALSTFLYPRYNKVIDQNGYLPSHIYEKSRSATIDFPAIPSQSILDSMSNSIKK